MPDAKTIFSYPLHASGRTNDLLELDSNSCLGMQGLSRVAGNPAGYCFIDVSSPAAAATGLTLNGSIIPGPKRSRGGMLGQAKL